MKYYILVGEASGDLHGSNLMKAILKEDSKAEFHFWGGDLMRNVGGELVVHYKERSFMGLTEVFLNLIKIFGFISFCKRDIKEYNPDVIIYIDNSGFNLRIAEWAKRQGFKNHYYISPQVWASREDRIKKIKRYIDKMFVILPFEKSFYEKHDYKVDFVGHPLIDAISDRKTVPEEEIRKIFFLGKKPIIAILPGSRKQEIIKMLSVMLSIVADYPDYEFVIAGAPSQSFNFYKTFIGNRINIGFINNRTYDLLSISQAAIVTSGTATLETALFKVPQVVCYKSSNITYQIAKRIITLKYISLVNLIMDKPLVTELIQNDFNKKNLKIELDKILDLNHRKELLKEYDILEKKLGGKGASEKAAKLIVSSIKD